MNHLLVTLFISLIILTISQPNNFDYNLHGKDWQDDCTSPQSVFQSPIILKPSKSKSLNSFFVGDFRPTKGLISFLNTTVYLKTQALTISFGETYTQIIDNRSMPFKANQIRIRSHSQHAIENEYGYGELQLQIFHRQLYDSSKNLKFAIGLLFNVSDKADPFLDLVIQAYNNKLTDIMVDLSHLIYKENSVDYWFYLGSATIPPCTDGKLYWLIPKKVMSMTQAQRDFFYAMFNDKAKSTTGNWREVQPQNNNTVGYYETPTVQ